jgi:hypothetical protein
MLLITRRSSTRRSSGWFFGMCGSITAQPSSLRQKESPIAPSSPSFEGSESDLQAQGNRQTRGNAV